MGTTNTAGTVWPSAAPPVDVRSEVIILVKYSTVIKVFSSFVERKTKSDKYIYTALNECLYLSFIVITKEQSEKGGGEKHAYRYMLSMKSVFDNL
jgi:hypothetical protein